MRFLITNKGHKDILLGYPWLATFEPKFEWKSAIIETTALPIILMSTHLVPSQEVIVQLQAEEEKEAIVRQLEETTTIRGIATELAIQAGEGKKKSRYQRCTTASNVYLAKKPPRDFPLPIRGTMPSNSNLMRLTPFHARFTQ